MGDANHLPGIYPARDLMHPTTSFVKGAKVMRWIAIAAVMLSGCSVAAQVTDQDKWAEQAAINAMQPNSRPEDDAEMAERLKQYQSLDAETDKAWQSYFACLDLHAKGLSVVQDPSEIVTRAVFARCKFERQDVVQAMLLRNQATDPSTTRKSVEEFVDVRPGVAFDDVMADVMTERALKRLQH